MHAKTSTHDRGTYVAAMRRALGFTREIGCTTRSAFAPCEPMITAAFSEVIREWARLNICSLHDERIAGMCMQITQDLVRFLQGAGIDAIYTLGWMSYRDHPVYRFSSTDVRHWLKHGIPDRREVDVHAWATLPSAEIIDPSWLSTVGIVQGKRDLIGAVIIADPEQRTSHQYHPVTVDLQVLFQIGLLHPTARGRVPRQAPPPPEVLDLVS